MFENGPFPGSKLWKRAQKDVRDGIARVVWPPGASDFAIRPSRKFNGVKPIKTACVAHLQAQGWRAETLPDLLGKILTRKDYDALYTDGDKNVALEWETGNISSSHRAINKLLVGFDRGAVQGAILVLPSRDLYRYVTDRVGNINELENALLTYGTRITGSELRVASDGATRRCVGRPSSDPSAS